MATEGKGQHHRGFSGYHALFITTVKQAIRQKDYDFILEKEHLEVFAEILGVNHTVVDKIKINVKKMVSTPCKDL